MQARVSSRAEFMQSLLVTTMTTRRVISQSCRAFSARPLLLEKKPTARKWKSDSQQLRIRPQQESAQSHLSPSELTFTGESVMPITSSLKIFRTEIPSGTWPVFRLMDESGHFRDPTMDGYTEKRNSNDTDTYRVPPSIAETATTNTNGDRHDLNALRKRLQGKYSHFGHELQMNSLLLESPKVYADTQSNNPLMRAHLHMVRLRQMDTIFQNAQRQGRISFYMTCRGEEAIHMGAASALKDQDTIFAQYREAGLLMWRGFTLDQFANQCFSNDGDLGRGRQMPVHYGCRALNYHTVSSPLGTQLPQAVGAAYHLKLSNPDAVAICFFGDGCASTTDFHSALNFAATLEVPCIFVCRNNGYAISTPVTDQYSGDGIVSRAHGYGMAGLRVDGNDLFAMSAAIREARAYALKNQAPILVEAMTYRQGHHSTSDDSTRYRSAKEVKDVATKEDPLIRIQRFLDLHGWMTKEEASHAGDEEKMAVLKAMQEAEKRPKPDQKFLFQDVYEEIPQHLLHQQEQLRRHISKYPNRY